MLRLKIPHLIANGYSDNMISQHKYHRALKFKDVYFNQAQSASQSPVQEEEEMRKKNKKEKKEQSELSLGNECYSGSKSGESQSLKGDSELCYNEVF